MNPAFQNTLKNKNKGVPPIWFMRQAGRYHTHYQKLKEKHTFMQLCKQPELAAEVTLGPILDFDFDVAIIFSDLLFPLEAMGLGLSYDNGGPELKIHLTDENIGSVRTDGYLDKLLFQKQALLACREILPKDKSLIGFVGGMWTLYLYATEGSHAGHFLTAKNNLGLFEKFWQILEPVLVENIQLQLDGGAEVVMIFDTAAGEVSPVYFQNFIAPKLVSLAKKFPQKLVYYSKGTHPGFLDTEFRSQPWAGFGFDQRNNLAAVLTDESLPGIIQGNFDQTLLFGETTELKKHFAMYIKTFKDLPPEKRSRWVCGLGHGVLPKTPEKHVRLFVEWVRKEFA